VYEHAASAADNNGAHFQILKVVEAKSTRECWKAVTVVDRDASLDDSTSFLDKAALAA